MAEGRCYWSRIKSGEITACPACGSKLNEEPLYEGGAATIFECSNRECCWNDESADLADLGHYAAPAGWKTPKK